MAKNNNNNNNKKNNTNNKNNNKNNSKEGGKKRGKVANPWLDHVKATMKLHPDMKFKDVLKEAKKTYKK